MSVSVPTDGPRSVARSPHGAFAGFVLGYTLLVVLFGAVVRVTRSGAGCGDDWPTCHGEIAHFPRSIPTAIELTHRVTSGMALVFAVGLYFVVVRRYRSGHPLRHLALGAVLLNLLEALIGASLVLFRLVETNASVARAFVMPAHLVSTFALTAVLTLLTLWRDEPPAGSESWQRRVGWLLFACAFGLVLVSAMGAVTALGDTIFPPSAETLGTRFAEDHGGGAHFLRRLRVVHPVLAVLVTALVASAARRIAARSRSTRIRSAARAVVVLCGIQLAAGVLNVFLSAPAWLQLVHLGLALGLWIAFVVFAYEHSLVPREAPAT